MIVLGVTGSIGMGKSTISAMLMDMGIPVHDADAQVHELMQPGAKGTMAICAAFPYFEYPQIYSAKKQGVRQLERKKLGDLVFGDDMLRKRLEGILHPLVRAAQDKFIRDEKRKGRDIVALDIPLLFETGADSRVDYTINVSAPLHIQQARVLSRAGMTEERFKMILAKQMPDGEKCARADYIVHTGLGLAQSRKELKTIINDIRQKYE